MSAGQDVVFPRAAAAGHYHGRASLLLQHPQAAAAGRGQRRQGATGGVPSPSPQGLKDAKQGSDGGLWGDTGGGGTGGERTGVRRRWVEEERRRGLVQSRRADRIRRGWVGLQRQRGFVRSRRALFLQHQRTSAAAVVGRGGGRVVLAYEGKEETERMGARKLKPHLSWGELPSC